MRLACSVHTVRQIKPCPVASPNNQNFRDRPEKKRCHLQAVKTGLAAALIASALAVNPALAKEPSADYISVQDRIQQRSALRDKAAPHFAKTTGEAPSSTGSVHQQVNEVRELSAKAQRAADNQDFEQALKLYTQITHTYPDLAIVQYAKVKHALMLYQSGRTVDAVLEMEGQEEEMRGNPEVHAALAAMLYSESPKQINRAETQWEIAREFDQRYGDLDWVKHEKQWPPAMQVALGNFLTLK